MCISKLTIFGSDDGLLSSQCQAIILTNAGILLIQTNKNQLQWYVKWNQNIFVQ